MPNGSRLPRCARSRFDTIAEKPSIESAQLYSRILFSGTALSFFVRKECARLMQGIRAPLGFSWCTNTDILLCAPKTKLQQTNGQPNSSLRFLLNVKLC
jgi:hypothetical protein